MKVLLIFPPLWATHRPYLSLPSLSAYLKASGVDVIQKDFNIEAYDLLLSESNLKTVGDRLRNKFETLDSKGNLTPGMEQRYYCNLYKAKSNVNYIAERVEKAKETLRNKREFYDVDTLNRAKNILVQAQEIISLDCFPSGGDLVWPINVRFQRSLDDIKKITQNRAENPFIELYEHHLLPFVSRHGPDIIGISITGEGQLIPALTLSRLIKIHHPKTHIVVGGYVVTLLADVLMKYEELFTVFFDSAVLYEGERPLLKLVESISQARTLDNVPNLIYQDQGKLCANDVKPPESINSLPTPCFDDLPLDLYLSPEPVLPLLSSRGCYWGKCAFCSHNESYQWSYQNRDANLVVDDMQELFQKHGVTHFAFSDEAMSPNSINKLSDEIIERQMKVRCSTNVRLERKFTPELCHKMFKAGFRLLYLGLESGCNRVLDHMDKGITKETAAEVCKNTCNAGLWNHLYLFFGFPTESQIEAQETINFLLSNRDTIHSFGITNFILNKGTAAMKHPERFGISSIDTNSCTEFTLDYTYTVTAGLTSKEAQQMSNIYREQIAKEYKHKDRLKLYYEDIILYLSHF
jgi:anaerobic magnesium-protoporphyrin IX monomethyl ester cyclase